MSIRQRLKQVAADTTADAVYEVLRACIIEGEFAPGQRLLSDAIASDLKVSRTPVREALRKLEAEGLIEASGRAGLTVREISEEDLSEFFFVREARHTAMWNSPVRARTSLRSLRASASAISSSSACRSRASALEAFSAASRRARSPLPIQHQG